MVVTVPQPMSLKMVNDLRVYHHLNDLPDLDQIGYRAIILDLFLAGGE